MKSYKKEIEGLIKTQAWAFVLFAVSLLGFLWTWQHKANQWYVLAQLFTVACTIGFGFWALFSSSDVRMALRHSGNVLEQAWREMNSAVTSYTPTLDCLGQFTDLVEDVRKKLALIGALENYQLLREVPRVGDLDRWNEYKSEDVRRYDTLVVLREFWVAMDNEPAEFTVHGAECAIRDALRERAELNRAETGTALAMSDALDLLLRYLADIGGLCFLTKPRDVTAKWLQSLRWGALMRALAIADFMERELKKDGRDKQIRARVPRSALADIMSAMNTGRQSGATEEALHYGLRAHNESRWPSATNAWLASSGPSPAVNPSDELKFLAEWVFQPQTEDGWWKAAMPFSGLEGDGTAFDEWRKAQTVVGLYWNPGNPRNSR